MTVVAQTAHVTGRHLRAFLRQPWFVAMGLVQPVIWLLLFGALFKSVIDIPGFTASASYLDYLVPGVLIMTALFSCGWSGMSIIEDLDRSIMDRLLATPIHRSAIIIGLNAYELVSLGIQALIMGGLAFLLGARFEGGVLGFAVLVAVRHAHRRDRRLVLRRDGAAPAPARVGHRHQHPDDPAADLPLGGVHAAQARARLGRHRGHVQPRELGGRGGA